MRACNIFKYEPDKDATSDLYPHGRTYLKRAPDGTGTFLAWGVDYQECNDGVASYTAAIIERKDGSVEIVRADMIQFTNES